MLVLSLRILRKFLQDLIQKVTRATAVRCGNAPDFSEAETIELVGVENFFAGIHLVDSHDHRLAAPSEQTCNLCVVVGDSGGSLHHEHYQIRLFNGDYYLFSDFLFENVIRTGGISSGIHH